MGNAIASEFIRYYLPGFVSMFLQQSLEKSFCCRTISSFLEKYIDDLLILSNSAPEVMLFTINPDENLINENVSP